MKFESDLLPGILIRRYKRFLADVELEDGSVITAHCPNTGSMLGCAEPGSRVWLLDSNNPKRKYPLGWELVEPEPGTLVGINTSRSNALVVEALESGIIAELNGAKNIKREITVPGTGSRLDLCLLHNNEKCFIEIKNVTLRLQNHIAEFPDAVTKRGQKHLVTLKQLATEGHRAILFYCVQRNDVDSVQPADEIDPQYGVLLREAVAAGVDVLAYRAKLSPLEITLCDPLPVNL
jgi:sugar fermentation stimulation protein A